MRRTAVIAIAATSALATGGILAVSGGAQSAGGQTIRLVSDQCHEKFIDNPPKFKRSDRGPSTGDAVTFGCRTVNQDDQSTGRLDAHCDFTKGGKNLVGACYGVYRLPGGDIYAMARTGASLTTTGAVTGGTGNYAGARGTFVSVDRSTKDDAPSDDTITLLG